MKLVASEDLSVGGKLVRRGVTFSVATEAVAGKLVRSSKARPAPGAIEAYLASRRQITPTTPARNMRVARR